MYRLLIVDDEEQIVNSLFGLLSGAFDFEIHRAYSGTDAAQLLGRMRFDIVLSDISMPQMTGLDLLDLTRRLWPACHFILLTAYNSFDYAYVAMKYDRVDYLLKIETYETICALIRRKVDQLDADRREQEALLRIGHNLVDMQRSVQRYFLKRMVIQGTKLPEQKDLDEVQIPIALHRPAMLALAMVHTDSLTDMGRLLVEAEEYIKRRLRERGLDVLPYTSSDYAVWVVQPAEGSAFTEAEQALLIQEAMDELFQMVEAHPDGDMALLCTDSFVPWPELHTVYEQATLRMERLLSEGGMVLMDVAALRAQKQPPANPLSLEKVNQLWAMIRRGDRDGFLGLLGEGLESLRGLDAPPRTAPVPAVTFLLSEMMDLYQVPQTEETRRLLALEGYRSGRAWADDILRMAGSLFDRRDTDQRLSEQWVIRHLNAYIDAHFGEDITLTLLAEAVHYNPSYLSRFYKKHTGKTLLGHLNDVRIAGAKRLLAQTGLRTGEIAVQCGFCSTKYFGQVFKKLTGITPGEYRQNAEKK